LLEHIFSLGADSIITEDRI